MEIHAQAVAVRSVQEEPNNKVRVSVRKVENGALAHGGGQVYEFVVDAPEDPFVPGEELTITVTR